MSEDLISRQAAIDALWKALFEYEDKTEKQFQESEDLDLRDWMIHRIFVQNMSDIDRQTILNMPPAEPRWIPVTERLPEPNEIEHYVRKYYLIQNEYGDMMVAAYHGNESGETWWEQMYAYKPVEDEIVAWMPLPTPWEGESDGR